MTTHTETLQSLRDDIRTLERDFCPDPQHLKMVRALCSRASVLGIDSAYLHFRLSACLAAADDAEGAFRAACRGTMLDPAHPLLPQTFVEARRLMVELLEAESQRPESEVPRRVYAALAAAGETDMACHLALARHAVARGALGEAGTLLEALVLLEPTHRPALKLLAEVRRKAGDEASAAALDERVAGVSGARGALAASAGGVN